MSDREVEIAAQVATQLIQNSLSALWEPISNFATVKRAQFFEGFTNYCKLIHGKSNLVRTLYSKNRPMKLSEVYVRTRFSSGCNIFSDNDIINKFASGTRLIIKGNGGSGKTIFLKHLWLSRFEKPGGRIPVFLELRRLNDVHHLDVSAFCRGELKSDESFGKGIFEKLCAHGKFEFIFDGFDEVTREKRRTVERQIIAMSEKYPDCCFLVSGREDDRFASWGQFEVFSVAPLRLLDVRALIEKIPFDSRVKKKFLEVLRDDFFSQHESFLSSPLLAVMMLMTFNENATIPSKLTEFYRSAFQTLLTWHDATKDSFERDRTLSVDEFRKVFSTFCLITYYDQAFEFDDAEFRRYIRKALKYHSVAESLDGVQNDMCESANLLQKDGLKYIFVHRSFQEYFAAECAMQVVSGKASEFLEVFSKRPRDAVFSMCYEIHPELVFDRFFEEEISKIEKSEILSEKFFKIKHGFWWCESSSIEVLSDSSRGLHVSRVAIKPNADYQGFFRVIELGGQVSGNKLGRHPTELLFDIVFESVRQSIVEANLKGVGQEEVKIHVTFEAAGPKVSIRNVGAIKFSAGETKRFRSKFLNNFNAGLKSRSREVSEYFTRARSIFETMRAERSEKEKSIEDILGV